MVTLINYHKYRKVDLPNFTNIRGLVNTLNLENEKMKLPAGDKKPDEEGVYEAVNENAQWYYVVILSDVPGR